MASDEDDFVDVITASSDADTGNGNEDVAVWYKEKLIS